MHIHKYLSRVLLTKLTGRLVNISKEIGLFVKQIHKGKEKSVYIIQMPSSFKFFRRLECVRVEISGKGERGQGRWRFIDTRVYTHIYIYIYIYIYVCVCFRTIQVLAWNFGFLSTGNVDRS